MTLGCEKNLVESERLAGLLEAGDWEWAEARNADVIFINTCGFIEDARAESLREMERWLNRAKKVVAYGCMVRITEERIRNQLNGRLDGVYGSLDEVAQVVGGVARVFEAPRRLLTPQWYTYLKISEGCSQPCSFCVIPAIKGKHHSFPEEALIKEAQMAVERGAREINVIAQDTTLYGSDRGEREGEGLARILRRLSREVPADWIRTFYLYPTGVTDSLIEAFHQPRVLPYFDIPIQHAHPEILKRMQRKGSPERYRDLFARLRKEFPDCYIRTSFIVGFPGETEAEFEALCEWVREVPLDGLSVFTYSREVGTPSARLPGMVPEEVKRERRFELTRAFNDALEKIHRNRIGKRYSALIEERRGRWARGRLWFQAAGVDGNVIMESTGDLAQGTIVEAEVTGTSAGDFWATL
ncbi:MAG: 30S ribosomal protein S12 methylthiotransferase RimO [bacterium JZ-2024 1]